MSSWIDKVTDKVTAVFKSSDRKHEIPEGVWTKCEKCDQVLYRSELERNLNVCPKCGHHMRIKARSRLDAFLDQNTTREELGESFEPKDVLRFKDLKRYKDRYTQAQKSTGEKDALVVQKGTLKGIPVVACAFEFGFMAGSMGSVVGARFCMAAQECIKERRALICFSTSGGARMQESLLSLMQMAKTSAVLARMSEVNLPFISVMSDPTMGGVSASLAMLGDINIAEPGALIGFAGPRVIEQTVREKLPEGFQTAEFLLEKGAIDLIIPRDQLRDDIAEMVAKMMDYRLNGDVYEQASVASEVSTEEVDSKASKKTTTKRRARVASSEEESSAEEAVGETSEDSEILDNQALESAVVETEVVETEAVEAPVRKGRGKASSTTTSDESEGAVKKSSSSKKRSTSTRLKDSATKVRS